MTRQPLEDIYAYGALSSIYLSKLTIIASGGVS
jgi:hypothetical protein